MTLVATVTPEPGIRAALAWRQIGGTVRDVPALVAIAMRGIEADASDDAVDIARAAAGGRLPTGAKEAIELARVLRVERQEARRLGGADLHGLDLRVWKAANSPTSGHDIDKILVRPLVVKAFARCTYRRAAGRWAGGNVDLFVARGTPACSGEAHRVWSNNGKWSGNDAKFRVTVMVGWVALVERQGLAVVDGRLVLAVVGSKRYPDAAGLSVLPAIWAEQARGFDLRAEHGYLAIAGSRIARGRTGAAAIKALG